MQTEQWGSKEVKGGGRCREGQAAPVPHAASKKAKVAEVLTEKRYTLVTKDQQKKGREETVTGNRKIKNVNAPTSLLTPQAYATQPSTVPWLLLTTWGLHRNAPDEKRASDWLPTNSVHIPVPED